MEGELLKKFVLCLIPLLILWGVSVLLVRVKSGNLSIKGNSFLQKLDSIILSQTNSIHLVKVSESEVLLIGVSPNQTSLIASYEEKNLKPLKNINGLDIGQSLDKISKEEFTAKMKKLFIKEEQA